MNSLHTDFAQKADIALAKPLSYEALHSHRAFLRVQKQFNMAPQDVLIVYPDMNLEPGEINFSAGGKGYIFSLFWSVCLCVCFFFFC